MTVPKLHYISQGNTIAEHLENVQKACSSGAELVRWNNNEANTKKVAEALKKAREITSHFQTRLIINDNYKLAKELKADGVFLTKIVRLKGIREFLGNYYFIGAAANTVADCEQIADSGADYIEFTRADESKQSTVFQQAVEALNSDFPLLAAGNISLAMVQPILDQGVYGVAISEAITSDFNSISKFNTIIKGTDLIEQVWKSDQAE